MDDTQVVKRGKTCGNVGSDALFSDAGGISRAQTVLYVASSEKLKDGCLYSQAYASLSEERREKVDKCRYDKDKYLSLTAGLLLNYGLRDFGIDKYEIIYNEEGKPYIKGGGIYFSISHSGTCAVCAVSNCDVGCDIEKITDADMKVAKRFFSEDEYGYLLSQKTDGERNDAFYRLWALKESFIKATGKGMKMPLASFSVAYDGMVPAPQSYDGRMYGFFETDCISGYKCAVCLDNTDIKHTAPTVKVLDFSELI